MGSITFGIPKDLVSHLVEAASNRHRTFVETGTFMGGTTAWAATEFQQVHSIEISSLLHAKASQLLAHIPHVKLHLGDSSNILPRILLDSPEPAVFWLDGHWCGGDSGGEETECPLLHEIEIINALAHPDSILLIDDARLFLAPPPRPHDRNKWPDIGQVIGRLNTIAHPHRVRIFDDVILRVPGFLGEAIDGFQRP